MASEDNKQTGSKPTRPVESIQRTPKQQSAAPVAEEGASATLQTNPVKTKTQPNNNSNIVKIIVIVVAVLIGLSILGSIVAGFLFTRVTERGLSELTGGKAKVDTKTGTVTVNGDKGKATLSTEQKLPAGFPSDVPVYQPSTIKFSASLSKNSYNVTFSTDDSSALVTKYYDKELPSKGWVVKENSQVSFGSVTTTTYTKGKSELTLVVTGSGNSSTATAVSLSYRTDAAAN